MNILLIKPGWFYEVEGYRFRDFSRMTPLNLGIIAALSKDHNVRIIDEDVEKIEYSSEWDLVAITTATFTSLAAYEISNNFRKIGIKTILGGVHPTLMPQECLQHSDGVVIGEAETVWPDLLKDLEKGKLEKIYQGNYLENIDLVPFPERSLFSDKYFHEAIQFTRGCLNSCFFCYLQSVPWKKYRKRSPENIYEEISGLKNKNLFIVDDNLFLDRDYVKEVMKKIIPLKTKWFTQAPTTIAKDEEMLDLMAEAGCFAVNIGFQSVNQESLSSVNVRHNQVKEYKKIVETIHKRKILVDGFFLFGFDNTDKSTFHHTAEMIKEMGLDDAILYMLTYYPGTKFFKKFDKQNRILNYNWSKYSWYSCTIQPKNMSVRDMEEGMKEVYENLNHHFKNSLFNRVKTFFNDTSYERKI